MFRHAGLAATTLDVCVILDYKEKDETLKIYSIKGLGIWTEIMKFSWCYSRSTNTS